MADIDLDFIERERIAIMWFNGKPSASRYVPYEIIRWYEGWTVRLAVQSLLNAEARGEHG